MEEIVVMILAGKHLHEPPPLCYMLKVYNKITFFITVDITEDVNELVARKCSGVLGPRGTDSEALQGWL